MKPQFHRLLSAIRNVAEGPPADVAFWIAQQPDPGELPSPWETWMLIGLIRHRQRHLWVADIIRTRLQGDLARIADMGYMGHPEGVPQHGPVPGMPEWEYYFHGIGCCITHKVHGDAIDVDFFGDSAEYFEPCFYAWYLDSLRSPEPPEQRIRELYPSLRPLPIVVDDLIAAGVLTRLRGDERPYRISETVLEHEDSIESFCREWELPDRRLWLAALIGDWPAANAVAMADPHIAQITAQRSERSREMRIERLFKVRGDAAADALFGLADLGAAEPSLKSALRSAPSGLVSAALKIVSQQDDAHWCPNVFALFSRLNPRGEIPLPQLWTMSFKYLLRHGYRREELLNMLPQSGDLGEAVLLALEHAPQHALPLIRQGVGTTVAATLALINKPWSTRELLRALEASDSHEHTAAVRAALRELNDAEAEAAAHDWESRHPREPEAGAYVEIDGRRIGPSVTVGEHMLLSMPAWLRQEMQELHERVLRVRHVVPPEPLTVTDCTRRRPWWKWWGD